MKEPTEAQIKEFWERCGFKFTGGDWCYAPDRMHYLGRPPPIDLNNLFKYGVPKDTDIIMSTGRGLANEVDRWVVSIKHGDKWLKAENKDLALALFCAIKEVVVMPKVWNKRDKNIPANAIYCGRPSKWGNPFKIGMVYQGRILTRDGAVEAYKDWLLYSDEGIKLQQDLHELKGRDLVGWCAPLPCHCDLLLEIANSG